MIYSITVAMDMVKTCINLSRQILRPDIPANQRPDLGIAKSKTMILITQDSVMTQVTLPKLYGKDRIMLVSELQLEMESQSLLPTIILQEITTTNSKQMY